MSAATPQKVPLTKEKSPVAIAVAGAVRYNKELKQRQGILSSSKNKVDFFRYKRFVRAVQSDEYRKQQAKAKAKANALPAVPADINAVNQLFVMLIQNQMILPVEKMKTRDAKAKGLAIDKNTPGLEQSTKAVLQDDAYYMWNYTPPNPFMMLYSVLAIVGVFAVILFPLWPFWMRKGVWYLSTGLLCLVGAFFGIAIVRLVIWLISWATMSRQFWLFPNLFEDCGVIESFKPLYSWEDPSKTKATKAKKAKKAKKSVKAAEPAPAPTPAEAISNTNTSAPSSTASTSVKPAATAESATQRKVTLEEIEE